jgi:hypothetical protein
MMIKCDYAKWLWIKNEKKKGFKFDVKRVY